MNNRFCSNCGQTAPLNRIDKHYISHEILHLLHFEKGFFYSVKELMMRPGDSIRDFIKDNRVKHMKPVSFLILTSLVYTLITHFIKADEVNNSKEKLDFGNSSITVILHWVQAHYGYTNIIMGAFIALCVQLLFKKYKYNFFEIAVLICFVMGQAMLLLMVVSCLYKIVSHQTYTRIFSLVELGYITWAIGQFFDKKKITNYANAFLAYISGYILFYMSIAVIGLLTDLIIKTFVMH